MSTQVPSMTGTVAAVDLGATSGRVMLGHVGTNELRLEQVARFPNGPVRMSDGLHWDVTALYDHVLHGLAEALRRVPGLDSIGIDTWACDYALLQGDRMLSEPFHYRDERTAVGIEAVHKAVAPAELYRQNGLQFLTFNSLYQLAADRLAGRLDPADSLLLIPDLVAYRLTGRKVAERTNASTSGLLRPSTQGDGESTRGTAVGVGWNEALIETLGLPRGLFPELVEPGATIGRLRPDIARRLGAADGLGVTAVGSHDTASAIVGVPMPDDGAAYISCGTWGLVGLELDHRVLTEASRLANFTNEDGVDGRIRYLHNVMGLWLLSESVRTWEESGHRVDLPRLLSAAAGLDRPVAVFDANDPAFMAPGDMPARIAAHCRDHDLPVPQSPAEFVRSILESLASAFADAVRAASELAGRAVDRIHLVGGGSQNELLCRLTADLSGLPVYAGPVEATAIGNVLVQARAVGLAQGSLESLRALVARAYPPVTYVPMGK